MSTEIRELIATQLRQFIAAGASIHDIYCALQEAAGPEYAFTGYWDLGAVLGIVPTGRVLHKDAALRILQDIREDFENAYSSFGDSVAYEVRRASVPQS